MAMRIALWRHNTVFLFMLLIVQSRDFHILETQFHCLLCVVAFTTVPGNPLGLFEGALGIEMPPWRSGAQRHLVARLGVTESEAKERAAASPHSGAGLWTARVIGVPPPCL
jgi:hypothetical protein